MPLLITSQPRVEPVSLAEAKLHLRVTHAAEDSLILGFIAAARRFAQLKTRFQVVAMRGRMVETSFGGCNGLQIPQIAPVLQVISVKYLDMAGAQQTVPAATYVVDLSGEVARIALAFGQIWPLVLPQLGTVEVSICAGACTPVTVDAAADTVTLPNWKGLAVGETVRLFKRDTLAAGDGAMPGGLTESVDYFVQSVAGADQYKLSATSGGAAIDITSAGNGVFAGEIPQDLKAWLLLAIGTLYDNRQQHKIDAGAVLASLPTSFLDGLLDSTNLALY